MAQSKCLCHKHWSIVPGKLKILFQINPKRCRGGGGGGIHLLLRRSAAISQGNVLKLPEFDVEHILNNCLENGLSLLKTYRIFEANLRVTVFFKILNKTRLKIV